MVEHAEWLDVIVVGAGQAGLATSYHLAQSGVPHVVLERARVGQAWRDRWDSFTFVTPNWMSALPGFPYDGPDPDGFMPRDEIVRHLERYAASFGAPVREGVEVRAVSAADDGFAVDTSAGTLRARCVVVAAGGFQTPRLPPVAADLPADVLQLHSSAYRNPDALPAGAVLVVGSGQSGAQIAEELLEAGRRVYLSVSGAGRVPRRYRGRDLARWMELARMGERTVDTLPSPRAKFAANPHVSGKRGGHTINLRELAGAGMVLLGRVLAARDGVLELAPDLPEVLARTDEGERKLKREIDAAIERFGLDAPPEAADDGPGFEPGVLGRLDLRAAGVTGVVWATGYGFDFSWVRFPVFDDDGYPVQARGATAVPGLFFVGLPWLHKAKSGLMYGVGGDAEHVANLAAAQAAPSG